MFAVVLDTCVLWPSLQRDFLLSLAIEGLYRPLWSSAILAELEEHEARKLVARGDLEPSTAAASAAALISAMRGAFDDACVEGWEPLDGTFGLPDLDDEHVVAAAVVGGAGAIVTANFRDFPPNQVPSNIQVKTSAEFAMEAVELAPELALQALRQMAGRYRKPRRSVDDLLELLAARYGMDAVVDLVRDADLTR